MNLEKASKFLSLVLRHKPEEIGLTLDHEGWADIGQLVALSNAKGKPLTRELLVEVVRTSDKQRFAIDPAGTRIRANQGHSIPVDLKLPPQTPPARLFHGTATRFIASIREKGLSAGSRQHVHLSADRETATRVGARHGKPSVLVVDAAAMQRDGMVFYVSENDVWLTEAVPVDYIAFPD
ncbi:MAG TPA: RNA 2'-phosphotransferase [Telluria sp.]|jgi:putative RNA 2'-phosphotransferase